MACKVQNNMAPAFFSGSVIICYQLIIILLHSGMLAPLHPWLAEDGNFFWKKEEGLYFCTVLLK